MLDGVLLYFHSFFFSVLFSLMASITLSSRSLIHSSAPSYVLFILSRVFLIYILFILRESERAREHKSREGQRQREKEKQTAPPQ